MSRFPRVDVTKRSRSFLPALLCLAGTVLGQENLVRYDILSGDLPDPVEQGWSRQHDRPQAAAAEVIGQGAERAWRIEDDDGNGPEGLFYRSILTSEQKGRARTKGFTYRWHVRIPHDTKGPTRAIETEVCLAGEANRDRLRFGVQMGRRGEELVARVYAGSAGVIEESLAVSEPVGFHAWTLLFDPKIGAINLFVGKVILLSTQFDYEDNGYDLVFGSRSTGVGVAEWRQVEFGLGLPSDLRFVPPPTTPHRVDVFANGQDDYFAYRRTSRDRPLPMYSTATTMANPGSLGAALGCTPVSASWSKPWRAVDPQFC